MLQFPLWKKILIAAVCALGLIYALPNFAPSAFKDLPSWAPSKTVNLGLDLQGGAHLLMQVETEAVIAERLQSTEEAVRGALREARVRARGLGVTNGAVTFTLADPDKVDEVRDIVRDLDDEITVDATETGSFRLGLPDSAREELISNAIDQSIEIVRRRVDEFGTTEPTIQRQGEDRILVQVPGIGDTARLKEVLNTTAKMTFHLVDRSESVQEARQGRVPPGLDLMPSRETGPDGEPVQYYLVERRVIVSGENLTNAQSTFQQGRAVVSFSFDSRGAQRFGEATTENTGEQLAIVLDNEVVSAPRINEPILGGNGIITGDFSLQETEDLAILLRAGALPAPLTYIEERSVGPGLGQDSIEAGKLASIIGFVAVAAFMAASYGLFGLMTVLALVVNLALILALLSALQATLTLPGIAGIVLTVGMAVDANVLIFERIREEARNGRNPISSVDAGYRGALSTIIDANLTTLIAAVLLFAFGSGPIRGFAVTLSIGIVTSMFTAIMVTRFFVVSWLRAKRPQTLPI
ncbi:protein translocase subunit SecD [Marivibrio halodurans]|uniref:Protein translocase subunit SecD n=1 Tax=Marivibrio halodurans TaxID=2039722 RepID=A0A8J7SK86_9PROT|nr:protein translocase subunit SecD [Marivibrio halodurans]MBP5856053.1 protein translocase subunit SecD [Marivibrio halodurans]